MTSTKHAPTTGIESWIENQLSDLRSHCRLATASLQSGVAQVQQSLRAAQTDHGKDEGDRANTSLAREIDLAQKSRDRALLVLVDAALKRINEGTFGQCLNCGQEINTKRLEAIPWVRYCITCQELIDPG